MEHKEEGAAAASVPAMPKSGHFADKENINPLFDQPKSCGQSGPGLYGIPPPKQQFARGASTGKGRMMRTPLADITALCMLQVSRNSQYIVIEQLCGVAAMEPPLFFVSTTSCHQHTHLLLPSTSATTANKALCIMLQGALPPKQQQQANTGAAQVRRVCC